jgi:hypothetical protein
MNFAANPVVAGLVPVISIGCLLTGIASFASAVRVGMAGTSPAMPGLENIAGVKPSCRAKVRHPRLF